MRRPRPTEALGNGYRHIRLGRMAAPVQDHLRQGHPKAL